MIQSIFISIVLLFSFASGASSKNLYVCGNGSIDVEVDVSDGKYLISVSDLSGKIGTFQTSVDRSDRLSIAGSIFAVSELVESHGVLGKGVVLNISEDRSILAMDGLIHVLVCDRTE